MSNAGRTLVTVATYNEIENLPLLVADIFRYAPDVDLLVIDDNSPDGTGKWVDEQAQTDTRLRCLHRAGKLGLGTATIAGMQYAIEHGYRQVLNLDADFSHPPKNIPDLLAALDPPNGEPAGTSIGSRYIAGGKIEGWGPKRHFMSRGVNFYARMMLGLPVHDCSGAFRCYRTEMLKRIDFDAIRSRGYSFQEEVLWHLKSVGCRFRETPITFVDRQRGASKINGREAVAALWIIMVLGLRNLVGLKPPGRKGEP